MTRARLVASLSILCLCCLGLWSLGLFAAEPTVVPPNAPGDAAAPRAVDAASAAATPLVPVAEDASAAGPARIDVADVGAAVPAFTGRVVDEHGRELVGVAVSCTPNPAGDELAVDVLGEWTGEDLGNERWQARLRELRAQRVRTTTGADGRFRIESPGSSEQVTLAFAASGYEWLHRETARPRGHDIDLGDVAPSRGVVVRGRVVDASSAPVAGAHVAKRLGSGGAMDFEFEMPTGFADEAADVLAERTGGAATTDAAGRFELLHLPAGELVLTARHADHPAGKSAQLPARAGAVVEEVVIALPAAAAIRGVLRALPAAAANVRVRASAVRPETGDEGKGLQAMFGGEMMFGGDVPQFGERDAEPSADGSFTLQGLAAGRTYRVWAAQSGRGFAGALCSQRVEVPAGSSGVELHYDLGITATCRVVDAASGAPIEQLWVGDRLEGGGGLGELFAFLPRPQRSKHYPDGVVTIASLRPKPKQALSLTIEALGFAAHEQKGIALPATGGLDLGTVRLRAVPKLRITVVDDSTGTKVAGAKVRLQLEQEPARDGFMVQVGDDAGSAPTQRGTTDSEGRCLLNALVDAPVRLHATAAGFARSTSEPFELAAAGDTERQVRLLRGGTVVVTVVDAAGEKQSRAQIVHRRPDGDTHEQDVDAEGTARFEHLPAGRHGFRVHEDPAGTFRIRVDGGGAAAATFTDVDVVERGEHALQLEAGPAVRVRGVVRENGVALAGAQVSFVAGERDGERDHGAAITEQVLEAVGSLGELGKQAGATRSDDDGLYVLEQVQVGAHRLRVSHKSRAMPTMVPVVLRGGDNVVDLDLDATALRGVVKDDRGAPIAKARVSARAAPASAANDVAEAALAAGYDTALDTLSALGGGSGTRRGEVTTDAQGAFELLGLEPGRVIVIARAKGFSEAVSAPIEVARGAVREGVAITLSSSGAIKVAFAEQKPFTVVQAQYRGEHKGVRPVVKMAQGRTLVLEGLRPGPWEVSLQGSPFDRGGDQPEPRRVEVVAGVTATIDW